MNNKSRTRIISTQLLAYTENFCNYMSVATQHHFGDDSLLDSPNFDPVAYINNKFPTESSLDELDPFVVGIGSKISALDDEISRAVQAQSRAGEQATKVNSTFLHIF